MKLWVGIANPNLREEDAVGGRDGTVRKSVGEFLHSNFSSIFTGFRDIAAFVIQHATPPLISPNFLMFPLHQIADVGVSQSRGLELLGREVILEEFQPTGMSSRYLIVTDGQTDRHFTVASPHSALASRGNNRVLHSIAHSRDDCFQSSLYSVTSLFYFSVLTACQRCQLIPNRFVCWLRVSGYYKVGVICCKNL